MAGGMSPREPQQPMPLPAPAAQPMPQQPAVPVPQMVIPSVSRRRLLSPGVNDILGDIVRQVSITTTTGNADRRQHAASRRRADTSVGISSSGQPRNDNTATAANKQPQTGRTGQKMVKDILKNIVAALDESESKPKGGRQQEQIAVVQQPQNAPSPSVGEDKKESGKGSTSRGRNIVNSIIKSVAIEGSEGSGSSQEVVEMLVQLLPKLPSLGINIEGGDWQELLTTMRDMLPDEGFAGLVKKLSHLPNLPRLPQLPSRPKLPSLPSLPKGPTITYNTTGPIDDDFEEKTVEGLSKVLTRLTHIIERNNASTITVTTRTVTPEKVLTNALEALAGHQSGRHHQEGEEQEDAEDKMEQGSINDASAEATSGSTAGPSTEQLLAEQGTSQPPLSPYQLQGLSDECVDVKDAFAAGNGYTTGMVVSGALPSGRICDTTTFTYTVRYGPYADCFDKKAVNRASFATTDTNTTGEASTNTNVQVQGCGPAVTATIKSYAVWAKKGYTWTVQKTTKPAKLQVAQGATGSVQYDVNYARHEVLTNPKLSATVQFDNLNVNSAATVSTFSYQVTSSCPEGVQHKSGTFSCPASTIPPGGTPLSCKFKVDLPCAAPGVLIANAVVEDKAVRSNTFNFPPPEPTEMPDASDLDDQLSTGECVMVTDEFKQGEWLVAGAVTDTGALPYGKLCGTRDFSYTATFGPFKNCGKKKAVNIASLSAGTPDSVIQSQVTLPIQVVGCAVYTPAKKTTHPVYAGVNITHTKTGSTITIGKSLPKLVKDLPKLAKEHPVIVLSHQRLQGQQDSGTEQQQEQKPEQKQQGPKQEQQEQKQEPQQPPQQQQQQSPGGVQQGAGCVSPIHFWKNCLHREAEQQNGRCAVVNKLPAGPLTPFFPQPGVKNNRHYKGVMGKSTNTGNKSVDMWFKAAQALVSTQLNELSGVALSQPVMDAVSLIGSVVGTTSTTPPTLNMQLPGLAPAINLLEMFNSGQAGVEPC